MTPKMCDKSVDTCPFMFDSVPDQYKTQKMCYKAVCFSTKKLDNVVFSNDIDLDIITYFINLTLLILTLMMIVFMKMILLTLFLLDLT